MERGAGWVGWRRWPLHLLGVLALMWPALINGQPFFFSDTTAYVRAADLAVRIATGGRARTAWTRDDPAPGEALAGPVATAEGQPAPVHGSDGRGGTSVMAGRSPYFGALLYLGWVTSRFWLFVAAQAIVAWWLLGLALRCFAIEALPRRLGLAALLAVATPVAFYDGLLLADALAGFGVLAFLVLAAPPARLAAWERAGLVALLLVSAASHLTHIVMLAAMTGALALAWLVRRDARPRLAAPLLIGAAITVAGLASVMLTNFAVKAALGRPPAMAPLMTARFIVDGPGRDFVAAGCGGQAFAACRLPTGATNSDLYLWSRTPAVGAFLTADPATRAALSAEDTRFARAVLAAYPLREGTAMAANTLRQLATFDSSILDQRCFADFACSGVVLPDAVRATLLRTPSGTGRWPARAVTALHSAATILALLALAPLLAALARRDRAAAARLLGWLGLLGLAMLANAFLGGAISSPQPRYQARLIWLVPLLATLAWLRWRRAAAPLPAADARS